MDHSVAQYESNVNTVGLTVKKCQDFKKSCYFQAMTVDGLKNVLAESRGTGQRTAALIANVQVWNTSRRKHLGNSSNGDGEEQF